MPSSLPFFLRILPLIVLIALQHNVVNATPPAVGAQAQPAAVAPVPAAAAAPVAVPPAAAAPVAVIGGQGVYGIFSVSPATMSFLPSSVSSGRIGLSTAEATERPISKQVKSAGQRTSDVGRKAWVAAVAVVCLVATAQVIGRHA